MQDFFLILIIALSAALASPIGGVITILHAPNTFFMSLTLGFAGGVLLATASFEMLPQAQIQADGSLLITMAGFVTGLIIVYVFDILIHRGKVAGIGAEQYRSVRQFYRRRNIKEKKGAVLAAGTSLEEIIEGISIGVGTAIKPGLGLIIGLAIVIDNLSEGLSVGELIQADINEQSHSQKKIIAWTSLIGFSLLISALAGWYLLKGIYPPILGFLLACGAGGLFYLTITKIVPEAEGRQFQESSALAMAAGFLLIFALVSYIP